MHNLMKFYICGHKDRVEAGSSERQKLFKLPFYQILSQTRTAVLRLELLTSSIGKLQ